MTTGPAGDTIRSCLTNPRPDDELDQREAARIRRRDQDAAAAARDLMRPGMGKVFKQIQDAQAKAGKIEVPRSRASRRRAREADRLREANVERLGERQGEPELGPAVRRAARPRSGR